MESEIKSLLRTIVKRVHPDLFGSHPSEKETNSESLKVELQNAMSYRCNSTLSTVLYWSILCVAIAKCPVLVNLVCIHTAVLAALELLSGEVQCWGGLR